MLKMIKEFIEGANTIIVRSKNEFEILKENLKPFNVNLMHSYEKWRELAKINGHDNPDILIFENQPFKGITIYKKIKDSVDWYDIEPYEASLLLGN